MIYSSYKWEVEAVLEGLALQNVDRRENLAELAANVRYTINAKKIQVNKLFNKKKEERRIRDAFRQNEPKAENNAQGLAERVRMVNRYFLDKFKPKEKDGE